jgi:hypothetical protein
MNHLRDWLVTFGMMIIKPFPETFIVESQKAKGKFLSAVVWLVLIVVGMVIHTYVFTNRTYRIHEIIGVTLYLPIIFLLFVSCVHLLYQRLFHIQKYYYPELLYLFVGIFIPFMFINLFINSLWGVVADIFFWVLSIYPFVLMTIALKTITELSVWQSSLVIVLSFILALAGFFCAPAFLISINQSVSSIF